VPSEAELNPALHFLVSRTCGEQLSDLAAIHSGAATLQHGVDLGAGWPWGQCLPSGVALGFGPPSGAIEAPSTQGVRYQS